MWYGREKIAYIFICVRLQSRYTSFLPSLTYSHMRIASFRGPSNVALPSPRKTSFPFILFFAFWTFLLASYISYFLPFPSFFFVTVPPRLPSVGCRSVADTYFLGSFSHILVSFGRRGFSGSKGGENIYNYQWLTADTWLRKPLLDYPAPKRARVRGNNPHDDGLAPQRAGRPPNPRSPDPIRARIS